MPGAVKRRRGQNGNSRWPLKILYVYHLDPRSPRVQSGRPFSIYREMLDHGHDVDVLQVQPRVHDKPVLHSLVARAQGKFHGTERSPGVARFYKRQVEKMLRAASDGYDVVFSPSTLPFGESIKTKAACVACVDTMFDELIGTYPQFANASASYVRMGRAYDRAVIANLDLLVVPSRAATDCAIRYGAKAESVLTAPFGGNLGAVPDDVQVGDAINQRLASQSLDFLFVGKDWHRKGGQMVVDVARSINALGVPSTVHVLGASAADIDTKQNPIRFYGDVDLSLKEGAETLFQLSRATPFFFVPSIAEAYGMAFVEAASLGLPLLGSAIGGIRDIISAQNGRAYALSTHPDLIAREVLGIWRDQDGYRAMALAARQTFLDTHNWQAFWKSVERAIGSLQIRGLPA